MNYYDELTGFKEDGLIAHSAIQSIVHNVKVSAAVVRGLLICKGSDGKYSPVTENADASKVLAIAATDFTPTDDSNVTQAYVSGVFTADKVYVGAAEPYVSINKVGNVETLIGEAIDFDAFAEALRKENIFLTSLGN